MRLAFLLLSVMAVMQGLVSGETRTLTLKQALDLALSQNPDLILARLDEQRAQLEVQAVSEPAFPRVYAGSGLAWSSGFPMSIEGSAPSVLRAQATKSLYNPVQRFQVAQTKALARSAGFSTAAVREEVAIRTAALYLDLERNTRLLEFAVRMVENATRTNVTVQESVAEGREILLEGKRASVNLARARRRLALLQGEKQNASRTLALAIGLPPGDDIEPSSGARSEVLISQNEEGSVAEALAHSPDLKRLESDLVAKGMEVRSHKAGRLPKIDLVAQYSLLAKYNNYEDFFNKFQRHNGQLGASIQVPLFPDSALEARASQSEIEAQRIRAQMVGTRSRIEADTRAAWQRVKEAESGRDLAHLDLDVAREQVTVLLAQMEEGRAALRQIEEARFLENEKWLGYYEARYAVESARLQLIRQTGEIAALLK